MRRGEVWWSQQPQPIGKRPVVLLSRDESYKVRNAVIAAQVTTTVRNIPTEVYLDQKDGLPKQCVVNLDTILTIRKALLTERICTLNAEKIQQIDTALKFALAID